ncbi:hypothetical protein FE257_012190 [Aspergillus nanangensis]|uniref:Uncharacterized protein n=1 Tax=Aspergillus nanangensis TaxID=2582783 RepID=A0AAD4CGG6_ASPNN|nr:hypothetical protein FE257_012190 [Aspergillus nanangensis]
MKMYMLALIPLMSLASAFLDDAPYGGSCPSCAPAPPCNACSTILGVEEKIVPATSVAVTHTSTVCRQQQTLACQNLGDVKGDDGPVTDPSLLDLDEEAYIWHYAPDFSNDL